MTKREFVERWGWTFVPLLTAFALRLEGSPASVFVALLVGTGVWLQCYYPQDQR